MPRTAPAMMNNFVEDWRRFGADAWNEVPNHWRPDSGDKVGWWTLPEYLGDHFIAPLIGAESGACIMQPNVHWTMQCLLSCKELLGPSRRLLTSKAAFPSVAFPARHWADLRDATSEVIAPARDGFLDRDGMLRCITGETALVVLSHVGFMTGERLEDAFIKEVAHEAHRHGALLAVDGYHCVGSRPINVAGLDVDLYLGGLIKEGCGSSGNAFVYIRPGLEITPGLTGWAGDDTPFDFRDRPRPHRDVRRRFIGGTPAVASLYHGVEGVRILLDAGLQNVWEHSQRLVDYGLERARALEISVASPVEEKRRGTMIILEMPQADRMCALLKSKAIYTDSRQGRYLRLAPFVWNTQAELERAFDALESAWTSGNYRTYQKREAGGPVT